MFSCCKDNPIAPESPKIVPSNHRAIRVAVLTSNRSSVLTEITEIALESFQNSTNVIFDTPYDLLQILEEDKKNQKPPRFNLIFIEETSNSIDFTGVINEVKQLTSGHPLPVIYFSDKISRNRMRPDAQMTTPKEPILGELMKVIHIFSKRFPNVKRQEPTTKFYPRTALQD